MSHRHDILPDEPPEAREGEEGEDEAEDDDDDDEELRTLPLSARDIALGDSVGARLSGRAVGGARRSTAEMGMQQIRPFMLWHGAGLARAPSSGESFYLQHVCGDVHCIVPHCQLRNLVWATSSKDVYALTLREGLEVVHYDATTKATTRVMPKEDPKMRRDLWISMAARENIVVAGGRRGEVAMKDVDADRWLFNQRINTQDEVNAIDFCESQSGATNVLFSDNERSAHVYDLQTMQCTSVFKFPWNVNHTTRQPYAQKLLCCALDYTAAHLIDADSGELVHELGGHEGFGFATSWHPNGNLVAIGSEDEMCRVYDVRKSAVLLQRIKYGNSVSSVHFSNDGRFLAVAEVDGMVQLLTVDGGYFRESQNLKYVSSTEVSGVSFSPDSNALFVGMGKPLLSLNEYLRRPAARGDLFF